NGPSTSRGAGRASAGTAFGRNGIVNWSRFVPVAEALPGLVPNSDGRLIRLIRHAQVVLCYSPELTCADVTFAVTAWLLAQRYPQLRPLTNRFEIVAPKNPRKWSGRLFGEVPLE